MILNIKNFQSIKDMTLPIKGFVVIKGRTNSGKSSVRRAINTLFFNEWDKGFIKKGTKNTEISLKYQNNIFKFEKPKNTYTINEEIYPKMGVSVPDDLENYGIKEFTTEAESFNLISPSQLDPLFMMSYSDQINTRILNKIFNVSKYRIASANAKKDKDNISSVIKQSEEEIKNLKSQIASHEKRLKIINQGVKTEKQFQNIEQYIKLKSQYIKLLDQLSNKKSQLNKVMSLIQVTSYIKNTQKQEVRKQRLSQLQIKFQVCDKSIQINLIQSMVQQNKQLQNTRLKTKISNISLKRLGIIYYLQSQLRLKGLQSTHIKAEDMIVKIDEIIFKTNQFYQVRKYKQLHTDFHAKSFSLKNRKIKLDDLNDLIIKTEQLINLDQIFDKYKTFGDLISFHIDTLRENQEQLNRIIAKLNEIGVCPTCGQTIKDHR